MHLFQLKNFFWRLIQFKGSFQIDLLPFFLFNQLKITKKIRFPTFWFQPTKLFLSKYPPYSSSDTSQVNICDLIHISYQTDRLLRDDQFFLSAWEVPYLPWSISTYMSSLLLLALKLRTTKAISCRGRLRNWDWRFRVNRRWTLLSRKLTLAGLVLDCWTNRL